MKYLYKVYKVIGMQEIEIESNCREDTARDQALYHAMQNENHKGTRVWQPTDRRHIVVLEKRA
ncbi:MAG: hypothetical protein A2158_01610 [Chloroflexi bacterium RBG_13_46_14]|nr:MAG: hypothetical protein A2158_01610 [Chloroflexi bacterium RBG_13_46_14]